MPQARDQLIGEMEQDVASSFESGRNNHKTDLALSMAGIIASLVATVLVTIPDLPKWIVATVAAMPALCASLQRVVAFRERSHWYFQHAARLRALVIEVKFADAPNVEEFARKRAALEVEMEGTWAQIGDSGGTAGSRRGKSPGK